MQPIDFEIVNDPNRPDDVIYRAYYNAPYIEQIKENLPEILEKLDMTFEELVEALQNELRETVQRSMTNSTWFMDSLNLNKE